MFSEKPLAMDAARAADLVAAAERHDLGLGCAPITPGCDAQRHARALAADGRLGGVQFAAATANVGRVDEWHDRPASFLDVGPLYDGAVYPLALLVAWFGRVTEVRTADAVAAWPPAQRDGDDAPDGLPPRGGDAVVLGRPGGVAARELLRRPPQPGVLWAGTARRRRHAVPP
nr:hypothetical protein QSJ49_06385 [Halobacterium salinarum]